MVSDYVLFSELHPELTPPELDVIQAEPSKIQNVRSWIGSYLTPFSKPGLMIHTPILIEIAQSTLDFLGYESTRKYKLREQGPCYRGQHFFEYDLWSGDKI